jgi:ATP-dependent Lon protease
MPAKEVKKSTKVEKKERLSEKDKQKMHRKKKADSDSDSDSSDDEDEEEMEWETESDDSSYHPPEKKSKTRSSKKLSRKCEESDDEEDTDDERVKQFIKKIKAKQDKPKPTKPTKSKKSKHVVEESEEEDDESEDEYEEDECDDEDDDDEEAKKNVYIMFGGGVGGDEGMYEFETNEEMENAEIEEALENDDDECDSEDEKTFMKEEYKVVDCPSFVKETTKQTKKQKGNNTKQKKPASKVEEEETRSVEEEYKELIDIRCILTEKLKENPKSKIILKTLQSCRDSISKLVKNARTKNAKDYHKLTKTEIKNSTAEIDYFKKKLSHKEQKAIMNEMKQINEHIHIDKPYRLALLQTKLPIKYKATVMQKLNMMKSMEQGDSEYHKMKTWVDTFMRVPFNVYKSLSVNMSDGMDVCDQFMKNAKGHLDDCVYGLDDAKLQILQMMGQWITNPDAMGSAIAIHGPAGTGKTSIAKEGISKILGREFAFISLGGAGDASFLEGHSYTYEGSLWGKIVQILIDSKCMNPVIYFDELDKLSDSARGQEITGILTHLIDKSQNSQFHDKYFSEVDFNLSKCLFIFSYNDENLVNPILRDRMYRIKTKGYDCAEKVVIAKKYMLPKIREQINFQEGDIVIPDDVLQYIISTPRFTQKEEGVRNLNRCLEIIHTKLNLFRLMHTENNDIPILGKKVDIKVTFPYTVSKKDVDILIQNDENQNQSLLAMYV